MLRAGLNYWHVFSSLSPLTAQIHHHVLQESALICSMTNLFMGGCASAMWPRYSGAIFCVLPPTRMSHQMSSSIVSQQHLFNPFSHQFGHQQEFQNYNNCVWGCLGGLQGAFQGFDISLLDINVTVLQQICQECSYTNDTGTSVSEALSGSSWPPN